MSETEIALARAYLAAAGQDPVGALIRSVRDLAEARALASMGLRRGEVLVTAAATDQRRRPWDETAAAAA